MSLNLYLLTNTQDQPWWIISAERETADLSQVIVCHNLFLFKRWHKDFWMHWNLFTLAQVVFCMFCSAPCRVAVISELSIFQTAVAVVFPSCDAALIALFAYSLNGCRHPCLVRGSLITFLSLTTAIFSAKNSTTDYSQETTSSHCWRYFQVRVVDIKSKDCWITWHGEKEELRNWCVVVFYGAVPNSKT